MRALILLLAAACASGAGSYGSISFKSPANYAARPATFSVGKGRITGSDLDLWQDGNCVRGAWGRVPVDFCRDDKGDQPMQHWAGSSGEFTVTLVDVTAAPGLVPLEATGVTSNVIA